MPKDILMTVIMTTIATIVATVIANQISKSSAIDRISQLAGKAAANIAKFMARFGVNIGFLIWSAWIVVSFVLSKEPITRIEIVELIYYCALGFWFLQNTLEEIGKVMDESRSKRR